MASRDAPPYTFTTLWGQPQYHPEEVTRETPLPGSVVRPYLLAALSFLRTQGQLSAAGEKKLANSGWDTALLPKHVKKQAWAFLDLAYPEYHSHAAAGDLPPVEILERKWAQYVETYDLSKRPTPNPYQATLIDLVAVEIGGALQALRTGDYPDAINRLRGALSYVPEAEQPLVQALLTLKDVGDPAAVARDHPDPAVVLRVCQAASRMVPTADLMRAICVLARRLPQPMGVAELELVCVAANFVPQPGRAEVHDTAWRSLAPEDQRLLADAVNHLFTAGNSNLRHLAMCAMRTVGDIVSARLVWEHRPLIGEGEETTIFDAKHGIVEVTRMPRPGTAHRPLPGAVFEHDRFRQEICDRVNGRAVKGLGLLAGGIGRWLKGPRGPI